MFPESVRKPGFFFEKALPLGYFTWKLKTYFEQLFPGMKPCLLPFF